MDKDSISSLLNQRQQGYSLPKDFYLEADIFRAEMQAVFSNDWLFACNAAEIKSPGEFLKIDIGGDSVIVLRDREGSVKAFHNTCRHRGSRICLSEKGRINRLVCPYHQWVYELDGRLINARQMPADFDKIDHGLAPVRVEIICGLVYISLSDNPPSLDRYRAAITPYIAPHQPDRTKVAYVSTIVEQANWKLVIENNRECYHCAGSHPGLLVSLVEFALPDDDLVKKQFQGLMDRATARWDSQDLPHAPAEGGKEFRCIRLPFNDGATSFTPDGGPACRKLVGDLTDPDLGSVRMFRVPNNWHHFLADHIIHFRVTPLGPDRTEVRTTWMVHEGAVEGVDYDIEQLTKVWLATNDEDRVLAENNHLGIQSSAYKPGRYAPSEFMLSNFADWYSGKLMAFSTDTTSTPCAAE